MTKQELPVFIRQMKRVFQTVFLVEFREGEPYLCDEELSEEEKHFFEVCNHNYKWKMLPANQSLERMINYGNETILVIDHYMSIEQRTYVVELMLRNITNLMMDRNALLRSIEQLNEKIYMDSLTGVYNRRYYDEYYADVYADAALAIMDVDNFKGFNDKYGHLVGDEVLRQIANAIQNNVRPTDAVIRYGGDEFLLIFMDIPEEVFRRKLEAIRQSVTEVRIKGFPELSMSLSIGGCSGTNEISVLLEQADRYLYQAKKKRNAVVLDDSPEASEE